MNSRFPTDWVGKYGDGSNGENQANKSAHLIPKEPNQFPRLTLDQPKKISVLHGNRLTANGVMGKVTGSGGGDGLFHVGDPP
jgi:hypothetical protein